MARTKTISPDELKMVLDRNSVIARNLKFFRQEQGLTYEVVGSLANMSIQLVEKIEKQKHSSELDPTYVPRLAKAFGIDSDALTETSAIVEEIEKLSVKKVLTNADLVKVSEIIDLAITLGPVERLKVFLYSGITEQRRQEYFKACELFERAYKVSKYVLEDSLQQKALFSLASMYLHLNKFSMIEQVILDRFEHETDALLRAQYYQVLAFSSKKQMKYKQSERLFKQAISEIKSVQSESELEADCLQVLGNLYREEEQFDLAYEFAMNAMKMADAVGATLTRYYAKRVLCLIEKDKENYQLAEKMLHELIGNSPDCVGNLELTETLFYLAICQRDLEKAKQIFTKISNSKDVSPHNLPVYLTDLAFLAAEQGKSDETKFFYKKASKMVKMNHEVIAEGGHSL